MRGTDAKPAVSSRPTHLILTPRRPRCPAPSEFPPRRRPRPAAVRLALDRVDCGQTADRQCRCASQVRCPAAGVRHVHRVQRRRQQAQIPQPLDRARPVRGDGRGNFLGRLDAGRPRCRASSSSASVATRAKVASLRLARAAARKPWKSGDGPRIRRAAQGPGQSIRAGISPTGWRSRPPAGR